MRYVVSVSYQAVKSRVYRLIDSLAEEGKSTNDVKDSLKQWWNAIHPSDRPVARKYLIAILAESDSGIDAIREGITQLDDFAPHPTSPFALSRLHALNLISPASQSRSAHLRFERDRVVGDCRMRSASRKASDKIAEL
jgi:hypothetical protein